MTPSLKEYQRIHLEREKELNELFDRTDWIFEEDQKSVPKRNKPRIYMPDGMDVLKLSDRLDIEVDWRKNIGRKSFIPLLGFAMFWNMIVVVMAVAMIMAGSLTGLIFLGLHGFVGVGLLGHVLSFIFNKTNISVGHDEISMVHSPVFSIFKKNKTIKSTDIDQFYVRKTVSARINGVPTYQYDLDIRLKNGGRVNFLKGLNHESLLFIEQEIENYLSITDKKIRDEAAL